MDKDIKLTLIALETALFTPDVRTSAAELDKLIADDFIEIGASGIQFDKCHVLERLPLETPPRIHAQDFELRWLAPNCAQLLYRAVMVRSEEKAPKFSLRSSIWVLNDDQWQMNYHQGTGCEAFAINGEYSST